MGRNVSLIAVHLLGICVTISCCGCSGPAGPKTVTVSGKVTYNGAPVKSGSLSFAPSDAKASRAAQALIVDGEYKTAPGQGLMVGNYKVIVQALKKSVTELDPKDAAKQGIENNAVPKKYMDLKTTDLEIKVTAEDATVVRDFDLND